MRRPRSSSGICFAGLAALLLGSVAACSTTGSSTPGGAPTVAVAFFPIEEIVREVGGDAVHVVRLVPPGQDPHEYDPTPQQLTALEHADVVVYLGEGFQPNLQKAIDSLPGSIRKVDLLKGLTLLPITGPLAGTEGQPPGETLGNGKDPHVWLDPGNVQAMAEVVAAALGAQTPSKSATFATNAAAYDKALTTLNVTFTKELTTCRSRVLVTSHRAFGYLAAAYGLTQVSIAGVSPTDEPSAKTIKAVADYARSNGVTTIFFQRTLTADLATTVANEIGAHTAVLDSIESPTKDQLDAGADYDSIMRENLAALRTGLGCT